MDGWTEGIYVYLIRPSFQNQRIYTKDEKGVWSYWFKPSFFRSLHPINEEITNGDQPKGSEMSSDTSIEALNSQVERIKQVLQVYPNNAQLVQALKDVEEAISLRNQIDNSSKNRAVLNPDHSDSEIASSSTDHLQQDETHQNSAARSDQTEEIPSPNPIYDGTNSNLAVSLKRKPSGSGSLYESDEEEEVEENEDEESEEDEYFQNNELEDSYKTEIGSLQNSFQSSGAYDFNSIYLGKNPTRVDNSENNYEQNNPSNSDNNLPSLGKDSNNSSTDNSSSSLSSNNNNNNNMNNNYNNNDINDEGDKIARWEEHTTGIGSKLLSRYGYIKGQGLGYQGMVSMDGMLFNLGVSGAITSKPLGLGHPERY